jgi:DMSO/TMAO reductase YedYZ molybdopterin-dependent catalytic subunit
MQSSAHIHPVGKIQKTHPRWATTDFAGFLGHGVIIALMICSGGALARAQSKPAATTLTITGNVEKALTLTIGDLQQMPRRTVKVFNPHDKKEETHEGVLLAELLGRAGVPQGPKLRGAAMATYIEAEGADGYRVILSLAETDTDFQDSEILVADRMNGQPMDGNLGPLRLVLPHDKRPARWVRMLDSIKVVTVAK